MKLKALLLACAVAGAGASFALADDGHGKHNASSTTSTTTTGTTTTGTTTTTIPSDCTRFELKGKLASVSASSFTLDVTKANDAGKALVGHTATIAVAPTTKVEWEGSGTLTGPNVGDSARVKALACGSAATLTARSVSARGPKSAEQGDKKKEHGDSSHKSGDSKKKQ
jgi:hypothetical protein